MAQQRRVDADSAEFGLLGQDALLDGKGPFRCPVKAEEAPLYMVYPYVLDGYRVGGSYKECLRSMFSLHTETFNIWSMILNSVLSLVTTAVICGVYSIRGWQAIGFVAATLSVHLHLPFSVGYHVFMPISAKVANLWRRLDVSTIFLSSIFLTFSLDYYVLPSWGIAINTAVVSLLTIWAVIVFWRTPDNKPLDKWKHTMFLSSAVLCYFYPLGHAVVRDTIEGEFTLSTGAALGVVLSLAFGGWAYTTSFPERTAPGWFDITGHSHAIMHLAILAAHQLELLFIWDNYNRQWQTH